MEQRLACLLGFDPLYVGHNMLMINNLLARAEVFEVFELVNLLNREYSGIHFEGTQFLYSGLLTTLGKYITRPGNRICSIFYRLRPCL